MAGSIRYACFPEPHAPVEIREAPEPELQPGAALLKVALSEVCGTDVHLHHGKLAGVPYPLIPGHVTVGTLETVRGPLADVNGAPLREGDRVTFLDVHRTCHACWYCLVAKSSTRCPRRKVYGITYGAEDGLLGGWSEAVHLLPGTRVLRLGNADFRRFMAGGCALPTALHAVERGGVSLGQRVLVLGSGPVGLAAVALCKGAGAFQVLCVGGPESRLQAAALMGADAVLDFTRHDASARTDWVRDHTQGRGADVVIEATGAPSAVVDAMRAARDGGTVVVVGQYTDHGETPFNPHTDLNRKHLDVRGCWGSDYSHFHRAVQVMNHEPLARLWDQLALESFGLDQADRALQAVAEGGVVKALIDPGQ